MSDGQNDDEKEKAWALFPLTRLRPEQVAGSVQQATSVTANTGDANLLFRIARSGQQNEFVTRYGDSGEDEFDGRTGTIPQRLLMMNGAMVGEKIRESPFNASTRIAWMAPDDPRASKPLTSPSSAAGPRPPRREHFEASLRDEHWTRPQKLEDLFWALINSTEFSWNH